MVFQLLRKWLVGVVSVVVVVVVFFVMGWEGWCNMVYKDQGGVFIVCVGYIDRIGIENIIKQIYINEECGWIFIKDLNKDEVQL